MKKMDLEGIIEQTYVDGSVAYTDDMDRFTYENIAKHFFELGAVWMKERLIEKAVKWLEDNQPAYREYDESGFYHEKSQHFIEDFKKAMKFETRF